MKKYPPALTVTKLYKYRAADIFCFSWPSQGKLDLNSYKADRDAAAKSANAIADSLRKLFAVLTALKANLPVLHIVAHSMELRPAKRGATYSREGAEQDIV